MRIDLLYIPLDFLPPWTTPARVIDDVFVALVGAKSSIHCGLFIDIILVKVRVVCRHARGCNQNERIFLMDTVWTAVGKSSVAEWARIPSPLKDASYRRAGPPDKVLSKSHKRFARSRVYQGLFNTTCSPLSESRVSIFRKGHNHALRDLVNSKIPEEIDQERRKRSGL